MYSNILEIYRKVLEAIKITVEKSDIVSVGIDTWGGVDFGLLDENGFLIGLPLYYRNAFKWDAMNKVLEHVGKKWIFERSPPN
jgi:sugar (pentulose or hexulose) kinase